MGFIQIKTIYYNNKPIHKKLPIIIERGGTGMKFSTYKGYNFKKMSLLCHTNRNIGNNFPLSLVFLLEIYYYYFFIWEGLTL